MDTGIKRRLRKSEESDNGTTVPGALRPEERQLRDDRRLQHLSGGAVGAVGMKEGEVFKPIAFASRFLTDCGRKNSYK